MKRGTLILGLGMVAGAAVLAYNLWAYCCGRCTLRGFLIVGPFETAIIGLTLFAALSLVAVKFLHHRRRVRRLCRCGAVLSETWGFCPECGIPRQG